MATLLRVSRALQVHIIDETSWLIADLASGKHWKVDSRTAAVVVALMGDPLSENVLCAKLANGKFSSEQVRARVRSLQQAGLLNISYADFPQGDSRGSWDRYRWRQAFDYELHTWDWPFIDYSSNGQTLDVQRMQSYEKERPDNIRYLEPKGNHAYSLWQAKDALVALDDTRFRDLPLADKLKIVASATALPLDYYPSKTRGAAHLRKTSPSGGGRHPSELYCFVFSGVGLDEGVYHISVGTQDMRYMSPLPDQDWCERVLYGAYRLSVAPAAIFVITSHFTRNRYRYREPRTLRTLYYDAGHLGGLIESLLDSGSTVAHGHQGFKDSELATALRCDSLAVESPAYLIAVGERNSKLGQQHIIGNSRLKP